MPTYDDNSSSPLPQTKCFITTHNSDGAADFYNRPQKTDDVILKRVDVAGFNVLFSTNTFPAEFKDDKDIQDFVNYRGAFPVVVPGGTVVRMVDLAPGGVSPMHRTKSLDYGIVLSGQIELVLEDFGRGPVRIMNPGDVSVQRATMHAWRNPSKTEWCRMLYVLVDAKYARDGHEDHLGGLEMPEQ